MALAVACTTSLADDTPAAAAASPFDLGLGIGSAGAGAQLSMQLIPQTLAVRAVANVLEYHHDTGSDGVDYSGKLKLANQSLLLDWLPFAGRFHLSGGVVFNHNALRLDGKPDGPGGTYEINGHTYTSAEVGTLTSRVTFRKTAPYLGLGWGSSAESGLHFLGDIGVIAQGKPKARLIATGGAVSTADLQQAQADLQDELDSFRWYPVVQLGVGYRF